MLAESGNKIFQCSEMAVCLFSSLLIGLCVGLYGTHTTAEVCRDPVVTPASLLVEYGHPAEVNCSIPSKPVTGYWLGWESKSSHPRTDTKTSLMWKVDSLTNWDEADNLTCYITMENDQCRSRVNLTIYKRPDSVTLSPAVWIEGHQTELMCQIKNVGPGHKLSVHWSRAESKQNKAFTLFNKTLLSGLVNDIKNVNVTVKLNVTARREDEGVQYKCAAELNLDTDNPMSESQPITITVHYKPIITGPLFTNVSRAEGESLMMECSADGKPSPHYNWTLPNNTFISNSSIRISNIHIKDQGQYTCTAYNSVGHVTKTVTVRVTEVCRDPVVTPESLLVEYGHPAEVNCSIPSKPVTGYWLGWESKSLHLRTDTEISLMWKVDSLTNWEEPDNLTCYISMENDQCRSRVNLTIYKRPDSVMLSPAVWIAGHQTELQCQIKNVGPGHKLSVHWSRSNQKLNNTFTLFNKTLLLDLVNEMKNVSATVKLNVTARREDEGVQYKCAAVLNLDTGPVVSESQPITITVHYKPIITGPLFTNVSRAEGESLMMECSADGKPSPHYNWTLPNNTFISGAFIRISNIRIKDQGQYTCTAYNSVGHVTKTVTVRVTEVCRDPVVTPASLLVEYGHPAEVNCSILSKPVTGYWLGWESKSSHPRTDTETSLMWKVDSLTNWDEADNLTCYILLENDQCRSRVNLTIYKRPDSVMLIPAVWIAGDQTELVCEIKNVGPGHKLSVHWSRFNPKPNNTFTLFSKTSLSDLVNEMKNVSATVKLNVTARREDEGVQYRCAAVLNLDTGPVVSESQPITITVHYKPIITGPLFTNVSRAEGESLVMECSADGKPSPHYNWTLPNNTFISGSSIRINSIHIKDQGQYTCTAYNSVGHVTKMVTVRVTEVCRDPVVTPASLLVEYGHPAEVNCSILSKPVTGYWLDWESKSSHPRTDTETSLMWKVDSLTNWDEADNLTCYITMENDQCRSRVNLTIYKRPDSVTLSPAVWIEGHQTKLMCEIKNVGPGHKLSVHWSRFNPKPNNAFTLFSKTSLSDLVNEMKNVSVTVKLNITARREDEGVQYKCAAVLNLDTGPVVSESQPITITVHYKPNITGPSFTKVSRAEGENLMMECSADGKPSPHYNWTLPNNTSISGSSIRISNIRIKDQGQYTCTAYNSVGHVTKMVTVKVTEVCRDPVVTPASLLVEYGHPAEVNCSIPSKPVTGYWLGWESKSLQPRTDTETSLMWKVDSLRNWEEDGNLTCYIKMENDQCRSRVNLTIYKRPESVTLSPAVWIEGDQTELMCQIKNVGPGHKLSVHWSRAESKQNNTFTLFNKTLLSGLVNDIKNVNVTVKLNVTARREDEGVQYKCAAVLNLDIDNPMSESQPITITVHYKPIITGPLFTNVSRTEGESLMMECSADGKPSPHYNWTLPNNTFISGSSIRISSLCIKDQGPYTCTVHNSVGHVTKTVTVRVTAGQPPLTSVWVMVALLAVVTTVLFGSLCILKHLQSQRNNSYVVRNAAGQRQL
ncbi:hemicentin-1-like isoform 3-T3 [Clarias gariepinus]